MHQGHLGIFSCPYLRLSSQVMHIPGDPCHLTIQGLLLPSGLFGSNLDTRDLETYARTHSGHF